jgi:hypothetical protein
MTALKDLFSDKRRAYVHGVAVSALALITVLTGSDPALAGLLVAVVIAVFDLGVAIVNTTSKVSYAIYGVALACQPVALVLQLGTDVQWAAGLALFSAILGGGFAAAKAPKPGDYALAA